MTTQPKPADLLAPLLALVDKWRDEDVDDGIRDRFRTATACADELQAAIDSLAAQRVEADLGPKQSPLPTSKDVRDAIDLALSDASKAIKVLSTILRKKELQGFAVADEILGSIGYVQKMLAVAPPHPPQAQAGAGDGVLLPRGLLDDLLARDSSVYFNDECGCINHSRGAAREYESGKCPHQRLRAALEALPPATEGGDGR